MTEPRRLRRRLPHRRVLTLVAGASLLVAACASDDGTSNAPATAPSAATESSDQPAADSTTILRAVLDAGTVIGDEIDLAEVQGRPVVAWFWAPWCTSCRAEGPTVAEVAADTRDDIVLIGVPGRGADADMQRFIDDTGTRNITHVADFDGDIWSLFGVFGQPAFAFISPDGEIDVFVGSLGERALVDRIAALTDA